MRKKHDIKYKENNSQFMIPKIIHYCWFGGKPLPASAKKCIDSWKRFFPQYIIKQWDESNFDVNSIPYTKEAYERGKYAFVSDYARFVVIAKEGGIYFDTDVEVIKDMSDIIERGPFMGAEKTFTISPGLGIAAEKDHPLYREILDYYAQLHFVDEQGNQLPGTVGAHTTHVLKRYGYVVNDKVECVEGIFMYPNEYFNPLDDATGKLYITDDTRTIHWYSKTWCDNYGPVRAFITRRIHRYFGINSLSWLKKILRLKD